MSTRARSCPSATRSKHSFSRRRTPTAASSSPRSELSTSAPGERSKRSRTATAPSADRSSRSSREDSFSTSASAASCRRRSSRCAECATSSPTWARSSNVNFGAFVDLGGVDGLVHVSELSWKHVDHPGEVVEVGQEVQVEVLDVDLERERVSLSLKATQEDPWRQFARAHEVGDVIEGRVTKLVPFGAFVELDDAIEGLVHISELAEHHVERPEDEVNVHDRIEVRIIDIDLDRRRISLSRKQALAAAEAEPGAPEMELEP